MSAQDDPQTVTVTAPRADIDPDDVRLRIGIDSNLFEGWQSIRVTRGIERCPSDFELRVTELVPEQTQAFIVRPGDPCQLLIGNDVVVTGYIDRVEIALSGGAHEVSIIGRGKCQDLVDCSAIWPGQQIVSSSVAQVAQRLAQPFGIEVLGQSGPPVGEGGLIPYFVAPIGATCWALIDQLCSIAGLLAYELPDGNLHIGPGITPVDETRAIAQQQDIPTPATYAASGFVEGVNVVSARGSYANDARFSEYRAYRLGQDLFKDAFDAGNQVAMAFDGGVGRSRVLALVVDGEKDISWNHAQQVASFEAARRWGRSRVVQITTDGWRDSAGTLYTPNTLVPLDLPTLKVVDQTWVISEVTYRKDDTGTACDVVLMRPEAFQVRPTLPPYPLPADIAGLPNNLARP